MYNNHTIQELEKIIISGILETRGVDKVCDTLSADDFVSKREKLIYQTVLKFFMRGGEWFIETYNELKKQNISITDYLQNGSVVINSAEVLFYVRELKDQRRKLLLSDLFTDSQSKVKGEKLDDFIIDFDKKFSAITSDKLLVSGDIETAITEYENLQKIYAEKIKNGIDLIGIDTGFEYLNKMIDGLRQGHLWVLGGYTNTGKTFMVLNIVANLIKQKKRIGFYSLEMSKVDIFGRLLGIMTGQNSLKLLKGISTNENKQVIENIKEEIKASKMFLYTELSDLDKIKLSMIRENMKNKVDLFVVDYIQLMQADGKSEYENMKMAITEFQKLATQLKVSIIVLSQISNEAAKNRNSVVMGFKGSGDIGAAADLGIELLPDKEDLEEDKEFTSEENKMRYKADVKMVIKKNRHGMKGYQWMTFYKRTGIFDVRGNDSQQNKKVEEAEQNLVDSF